MYTHIDLCCGLGGWQQPYKDSPQWRSVGIDIRRDLSPDIVADVQQLPLRPDMDVTVITASPSCTEFSRYSMPWLDEPHPDMSLVRACLDAINELQPEYWILENVQGLKQYTGKPEQKRVGPYYLWGEFPAFDVGGDIRGKMQTSGMNPEERARIPYMVADSLRRSIEWTL